MHHLNRGDEYVLRFNPKYLSDPYYGVFINDDIIFTAEFLGVTTTFKSGDIVEIPFTYQLQNEDLKVHISWTQKSINYIDSKYSKGDTYLLIDNITYGYKDLLNDNISDYDYAIKLELNNIDPQSGNAYTKDIDKEFTENGSFKLKDIFIVDDALDESESDIVPVCNINMKFFRKIYAGNSYLIHVNTNPAFILLNDERLEFSYDETIGVDKIETSKQYIYIDDNTKCHLSWTELGEISGDLSGGVNKQKITVYIVAWLEKSYYTETIN